VEKRISDGGYLIKEEYEKDNYDWICSNGRPYDFLTLVRFTIMTKLCKSANLHTRQFLSHDGDMIFMVIKSNELVIKKEA
jgi:hypothetical protein